MRSKALALKIESVRSTLSIHTWECRLMEGHRSSKSICVGSSPTIPVLTTKTQKKLICPLRGQISFFWVIKPIYLQLTQNMRLFDESLIGDSDRIMIFAL